MTPNELCENCGFEKYRHNEKEGIVYTGLEPRIYDCSKVCKEFTPKIEKTEVQTICPLGETIPDFTPKIEKFKENNNQQDKNLEGNRDVNSKKGLHDAGSTPAPAGFSTPNCEICKDYPKEYWCGNPENKLSLKEQENKDDFELGKKEGIRFTNIKNKKLLSSLQEKIKNEIKEENLQKIIFKVNDRLNYSNRYGTREYEIEAIKLFAEDLLEELQKIFKEMGQ